MTTILSPLGAPARSFAEVRAEFGADWSAALKADVFPLRRIVACAHRAMTAYNWSRRVAIKFAIGHYKAGTLSDSVSYVPKYKPRHEMSGETQNMLTHRRRSMAR